MELIAEISPQEGREAAPVQLKNGKLRMRVVVDRSMCEVIYNDGQVCALHPKSGGKIGELTLDTTGTVEVLKVYGKNSIWE